MNPTSWEDWALPADDEVSPSTFPVQEPFELLTSFQDALCDATESSDNSVFSNWPTGNNPTKDASTTNAHVDKTSTAILRKEDPIDRPLARQTSWPIGNTNTEKSCAQGFLPDLNYIDQDNLATSDAEEDKEPDMLEVVEAWGGELREITLTDDDNRYNQQQAYIASLSKREMRRFWLWRRRSDVDWSEQEGDHSDWGSEGD